MPIAAQAYSNTDWGAVVISGTGTIATFAAGTAATDGVRAGMSAMFSNLSVAGNNSVWVPILTVTETVLTFPPDFLADNASDAAWNLSIVKNLEIVATVAGETSNSYVTLEDAIEYAEYRVGGKPFLLLSEPDQIRALVTAARDIDTLGADFLGDREDATQVLEWPRGGGTLPVNLVRANIELAMSYAPTGFAPGFTGDALSPAAANGNVKSIEVGPIRKEWFEPSAPSATGMDRFPPVVQRLLASLIYVPSSGWGSAVVTRGS